MSAKDLLGVFGQRAVSWGCSFSRPSVAEGVAARTTIGPNSQTSLHAHGGAILVCEQGELDAGICVKDMEENPGQCPAGDQAPKASPASGTSATTTRGNPIDAGNGRKIETAIDFESAGPNPLQVRRVYVNNGLARASALNNSLVGAAWRINFDGVMIDYGSSTGIFVSLPDGKDMYFDGQGSWGVENGAWAKSKGWKTLWTVEGDNYVFTTDDGTRYIFNTTNKNIYNSVPLSRVEYPGGYWQNITTGTVRGKSACR